MPNFGYKQSQNLFNIIKTNKKTQNHETINKTTTILVFKSKQFF